MENLESVIESVVFVAGEAISVSDLCVKFDVKPKEVEKAVNNLKKKYDEKSGIQILFFNNKIQFSSNPKNVDYVTAVLNPIRQRNLTKSTLETIAIVAYKQPVTRLEIEEIRGVNSDYAINVLLEHKLIEVVGRKDTVGKPSLFGTTDEFLKRFDISSVSELPKYEDLMAQIEKIRETYSDSLFNRFEPTTPPEEELDKKLEELNKTSAPKSDDKL
jgi:segregation and condensation protein B